MPQISILHLSNETSVLNMFNLQQHPIFPPHQPSEPFFLSFCCSGAKFIQCKICHCVIMSISLVVLVSFQADCLKMFSVVAPRRESMDGKANKAFRKDF